MDMVGTIGRDGSRPLSETMVYWMRMAGGGFSLVGAIFAAILIKPRTYAVLLPLMGLDWD
jgi:hypothetical protein